MSVRIRARLSRVTINGDDLRRRMRGFASDTVREFNRVTSTEAKRMVSPGVGPGPHPHRPGIPHVDTGYLRSQVFDMITDRGLVVMSEIGTSVGYGLELELGFFGPSGRFYRYPWLRPAWSHGIRELRGRIMPNAIWRHFGGSSAIWGFGTETVTSRNPSAWRYHGN